MRIGLFGRLGAGNIGNDGTLEAVLAYLRREHPHAQLDAMCSGFDRVTERYGLPSRCLHWDHDLRHDRGDGWGNTQKALRIVLGLLIDLWRTGAWVRRHDVVIVPGSGSLESTLPGRPWQLPYSMFLMSSLGALFRTRVALVSVGGSEIAQRADRWLMVSAARRAYYRSFRDDYSRDAMRRMGVDVRSDIVYPDLVFSLPTPPAVRASVRTVGVGVIAYYGANSDRRHGQQIYDGYVATLNRFVRWLTDKGYNVRLLVGDDLDEAVVTEVLADLRISRPNLDPARVSYEPTPNLATLMEQIAAVDVVVASRYHNVLCALKSAKPAISIGYGVKHDVLMNRLGVGRFCLSIRDFDHERLVERFQALEADAEQIGRELPGRVAQYAKQVDAQFAALATDVFASVQSQGAEHTT